MDSNTKFEIPSIDDIDRLSWRHQLLMNFPEEYRLLGELIHHRPGNVEESDFGKLAKISKKSDFLLTSTELACLDLVHAFSQNSLETKTEKIIKANLLDFSEFQNNLRTLVRSK